MLYQKLREAGRWVMDKYNTYHKIVSAVLLILLIICIL
jgi:hypothetical protein